MSSKIKPASTSPLVPGEYAASTLSASYDQLLGNLYAFDDKVYQLVKTSSEEAISKRILKWTSRSAFTVERGTALTDTPAGVGASMFETTTPASSYVLIQVGGRATVTHGDDATNTLDATRPFAIIDDDADEGKVRGTRLPTSAQQPFGRYISGTAADGADMTVELDLDFDARRVPLFGLKSGTFVGKNGTGACTATGAVVGDRVVLVQVYGDVSDNLTRTVDGAVTAGGQAAALFETVITVADQIQQASASDLSDNKYLLILAPPIA